MKFRVSKQFPFKVNLSTSFTGGTIDVTVHEILEDGRVRELYKATGGAWGGNKVDEAFIKYFCDIFSEEVVESIKQLYPSEFVDMMHDFEQIKRRISLNDRDEIVRLTLPRCVDEVYLDIMNISVQNAFNDNKVDKTRGASLDRFKLQIPRIVILEMIEEVAKSISAHTTFLLNQVENLGFIVMVGGFSNSPIVIQEIKDQVPSFLPVIVPENPELCVVKGAVMFGWTPHMFKSRKSKRTYGTNIRRDFRENIDPARLMCYDDDNVKNCKMHFDEWVCMDQDVEIDQMVTKRYTPASHNQKVMNIDIYESEESDISYCDEPGIRKLGNIKIPMTDTTGDKDRKVEVKVRFGHTEFFVTCKDVTTGVVHSSKYDFL